MQLLYEMMNNKEYILICKDCNSKGELLNVRKVRGIDTFDNHYKYLKKIYDTKKCDNCFVVLSTRELIVQDGDVVQYVEIVRV